MCLVRLLDARLLLGLLLLSSARLLGFGARLLCFGGGRSWSCVAIELWSCGAVELGSHVAVGLCSRGAVEPWSCGLSGASGCW